MNPYKSESRPVSTHSAFASNDPRFDSYDALRDCVTTRSRRQEDTERSQLSWPSSRNSSRLSSAVSDDNRSTVTPYESYMRNREGLGLDGMASEGTGRGHSTRTDPIVNGFIPEGLLSRGSSSVQEENPQDRARVESPPLEDLSPSARSIPSPKHAKEQPSSVTIRGVGVGNAGIAVRGELASFDVTCKTLSGDPWIWKAPPGSRSELPLRVEVDDVSGTMPAFIEPVWIQYISDGLFRASYVVPATASSIEVKVHMCGKQVGQPVYHVYTTISMPLEAAKTIGSGVNPVDSLFVSSQPKTLLTQPRDVALSPDGMYVCVTDVECHQVLVYSGVDSKLMLRLGEHIERDLIGDSTKLRPIPGRLHHPWGVAVSHDTDTIAVTDAFHHCVQLFDAHDGSCLRVIGNGKGHVEGCFNKPAGVRFDSRGNIFVSDSGNHRVQLISGKSGQVIASIGHGEGIDFGYLKYPLGIDVSADDSLLFVADSKNNRISVFDTKTGEFVRAFGETFLSQPIAVTVSQDRDAVFVRDNEFDRVFVFNSLGQLLCVLGQCPATEEDGADAVPRSFPGKLVGGAGMAVTRFGHLYAIDKETSTVVVLRAPVEMSDNQSDAGSLPRRMSESSIVTAITNIAPDIDVRRDTRDKDRSSSRRRSNSRERGRADSDVTFLPPRSEISMTSGVTRTVMTASTYSSKPTVSSDVKTRTPSKPSPHSRRDDDDYDDVGVDRRRGERERDGKGLNRSFSREYDDRDDRDDRDRRRDGGKLASKTRLSDVSTASYRHERERERDRDDSVDDRANTNSNRRSDYRSPRNNIKDKPVERRRGRRDDDDDVVDDRDEKRDRTRHVDMRRHDSVDSVDDIDDKQRRRSGRGRNTRDSVGSIDINADRDDDRHSDAIPYKRGSSKDRYASKSPIRQFPAERDRDYTPERRSRDRECDRDIPTSHSKRSENKAKSAALEHQVFEAVEEGLTKLIEVSTITMRKEFEDSIKEMEARIMENMKKLIATAVQKVIEESSVEAPSPTRRRDRDVDNTDRRERDRERSPSVKRTPSKDRQPQPQPSQVSSSTSARHDRDKLARYAMKNSSGSIGTRSRMVSPSPEPLKSTTGSPSYATPTRSTPGRRSDDRRGYVDRSGGGRSYRRDDYSEYNSDDDR